MTGQNLKNGPDDLLGVDIQVLAEIRLDTSQELFLVTLL